MINSNTSIQARRAMAIMPMVANVKSGPNGELTFNVTIKPELLDPVMGMIGLFSQELRRAMRTRDFWRDQAIKEKVDHENRHIEFMQRQRVALSVYRRTGSARLAARAGQWIISDIRMFVRHDDVDRHKAMKAARNLRIQSLSKSGMSCRDIADQFCMSASQIWRIAHNT